MRSHLISACCNKLSQDVNRLVETCAFVAVYTTNFHCMVVRYEALYQYYQLLTFRRIVECQGKSILKSEDTACVGH